MDDWGVTWRDLGYTSRTSFQESCESNWNQQSAEMEPRQVEVAQDSCDATEELLTTPGSDPTINCDILRVLYL